MREYFVLRTEFASTVFKMDDERAGNFIKALFYFFETGDRTWLPEGFTDIVTADTETFEFRYIKHGRGTPEYRKWKKAVFTRDNFTCQMCGNVGGALNAHHIKPYANFMELRYDVNNGITLCEECHKEIHRKVGQDER